MKKRNVWRDVSAASLIAAAVVATAAPTASAEETTVDYSETYYKEFSFVTNDGTPVTVTYDAETNTYVGNVPLNTTAVTFNLPLKDGYTSTTSASYKLTFTTTPISHYSENVKGRNIEIKDADKNVVAKFRVELTRPAEPQTVETSSELLSSSITFYNGRSASVANPRFYVEEEGELKVVSTNNQLKDENIETYDRFIVKPVLETNIQNIETITLSPVAKYFNADDPNSAQYTYRVNGEIVESLTKIPHIAYEYEPGKYGTQIEVTVTPSKTAPEGSKPKTYTFIIPKETSTETALTGFAFSSANNHQFLAAIGEGKLTQKTEAAKTGFNKTVTEYETITNYNVDNILVKTTAEGPYTTFVYNVNGEEIRTTEKQKIVPLKVGKNIITVQAIPENGDATNSPVYTLHAERKENYNIASIKSDEIRISGKLRPTLTTLAGIIEDGIEKYTIDLAAEDPSKTITVQQNDTIIAKGKGSIKATLDASNIVVEGTKNISQNPVTIIISDDNDSITYTLDTWKRNPDAPNRTYAVLPAPGQFVNEHAQTVTGSLGSFGWGDGWDTALYSTSASLSDEASGKPGLSLGGFGGFVTYQFDDAVKNDPAHPYGADFIINGNGFSGNEEPGGVMVAQDKDKDGKPDKDADGNEIWYELAGSEHYEDTTLWDYTITYKNTVENFTPNFSVNVPWFDSLGRSGEILANGYHAQIYFPMPENYQFEGNAANDLMGDEITFNGTNIQTLKSLFGYADVSPNNKGVATAQNPYTHKHGGGGFMDISWAVDKDGKPVNLDEVSFVKIYTNQQTDGGAVGEKSPEILGMLRVNDPNKSDGKTAKPTITVNDQAVTLGAEDDFTPVVVESLQNVKVDVTSGAENIFINNEKVATRTYEVAPEKGIVRVIVQTGNLQPTIYTLKLVEKAVQHTIDAIAALQTELTLDDTEAVNAAQTQYDALTEKQQALVTNKHALDAAQATIAALQGEKETNEATAKTVEDAIAALPETITLANMEAVQTVQAQYDALTDVQQALVPNKDVLNKANETIATLQAKKEADEAAAKAVEETIAALPTTLILEDATSVQKANEQFNALTEEQKALVLNKDVLEAAQATIAALQVEKEANEAAAQAVTEAINALPADITLEHATVVQDVTTQFNTLTEAQQALVANQDVLTKAMDQIATLQAVKEANEAAAKAVEELIAALPEEITLAAEDDVQAAFIAYELLTDVQKALVLNKHMLDQAKRTIADLQTVAEQQAAIQKENEAIAQAVQETIAALPTELTLEHAMAVQEATTKYNSLTDVQKALVQNKDALDAANDNIATLQAKKEADEAAAKAVAEQITALPALLTLDAKEAVQNAKAKFDLLSAEQQTLVSNKEVLEKALQAIDYLQNEADKQAAIQKENEAAAKLVEDAIAALPTELTLEHKSAVQNAADQYAALTNTQKVLVTNKAILDAAQSTMAALELKQAANEAAAKTVENAIAALPKTITLEQSAAVEAVNKQFTALTAEQKALVTNQDVLEKASETIAALQAVQEANNTAAKAVEDIIAALPTNITLNDATAIQEATSNYDRLTKEQQALVTNEAVLEAAQATIAQLQAEKEQADALQKENEAAAKAVEDIIAALPETITLTDEEAVQAAVVQYELLTDTQKALVTNKDVLDAAQTTIAALQAEKDANEAAAKAVEDAIAALPETITLTDEEAVQATSVQYELLTDAQQALVPNKDVLDAAKQAIADLQTAAEQQAAKQKENEALAKAVEEIIAALPTAITLNDVAAVQNAATKYEGLTEEQQALVTNKDVLDKANETIATLQAANEAAAKVVVDAIAALPTPVKLTHKATVEEADAQYAALTAEQQALVTNKGVLDAAKKEIARLQQNTNNNTNSNSSNTSPAMPSMPAQPAPTVPEVTQPEKPEVTEPETPEITEPETPEGTQPDVSEPETPEATTPDDEQTWIVTEAETVFTSAENIVLSFPSDVAGTVANVVAEEDRVQVAFKQDEADVILSQYVEVVIPQDVLSPKDGVLVQRLADGSVVAVPHRLDENGEFVARVLTTSDLFVQNTQKDFKDIAQDGHKQYIEALAERLIVNGTTAETFSPKATMTRGQFAAMLQRSLALPKTKAASFKDTSDNQFTYELQTLVDIGVLKGDGDLLKPKDNITRKQAALMIARLLEHLEVDVPAVTADDATFTDKEAISPDALEAVALMKKLQIFSGKEDGRFDPNAPLTRSQMAKVLYQTLKYVDMM